MAIFISLTIFESFSYFVQWLLASVDLQISETYNNSATVVYHVVITVGSLEEEEACN